jgi:hypothetical protein
MESKSVLPKHVAEAKMVTTTTSSRVMKYYDAFIGSIIDKRLRAKGVEYLIKCKLLAPPLTIEQRQQVDAQRTQKRRQALLNQLIWVNQNYHTLHIWCRVDICRAVGAQQVDDYEMDLIRNGWLDKQSAIAQLNTRTSCPIAIPLDSGNDIFKSSLAIDAARTNPVTTLIEGSTPKQPKDVSILTRSTDDIQRMTKAMIIKDLNALDIQPHVYSGLLKSNLVTFLLRLINKLVPNHIHPPSHHLTQHIHCYVIFISSCYRKVWMKRKNMV